MVEDKETSEFRDSVGSLAAWWINQKRIQELLKDIHLQSALDAIRLTDALVEIFGFGVLCGLRLFLRDAIRGRREAEWPHGKRCVLIASDTASLFLPELELAEYVIVTALSHYAFAAEEPTKEFQTTAGKLMDFLLGERLSPSEIEKLSSAIAVQAKSSGFAQED